MRHLAPILSLLLTGGAVIAQDSGEAGAWYWRVVPPGPFTVVNVAQTTEDHLVFFEPNSVAAIFFGAEGVTGSGCIASTPYVELAPLQVHRFEPACDGVSLIWSRGPVTIVAEEKPHALSPLRRRP
jgi:hypothetical protein